MSSVDVVYLDTSALVKLIVVEPESSALRAWIERSGEVLVTSSLSEVELRRAARRHGRPALELAEALLATVDRVAMAPDLLRSAGRLRPPALRSLDAIHLATALSLNRSLSVFVAYDERLHAAAASVGLPVLQPR